ncbi:hypothetical protein ElyMa_001932500 [Elysia marginata]|uniref:Uncharacterized protein n=1 Tax=Elysia marginata TaxID=1093978 RepID=A0AAV4EXE4_9GAST|nr:hypothetical protein ElyMa_001932500 [Elysia marginata]
MAGRARKRLHDYTLPKGYWIVYLSIILVRKRIAYQLITRRPLNRCSATLEENRETCSLRTCTHRLRYGTDHTFTETEKFCAEKCGYTVHTASKQTVQIFFRFKMALTRKRKIFLLWWYRRKSLASKRRHWIHPICKDRGVLGEFKLLPQIFDDDEKCLEYFRMTPTTFISLLKLCTSGLQKQNANWRKAITPKERLVVTLR